MFLVFSNRFLGAVLGLWSLSARRSWYFSFDELTGFDKSCVTEFKIAWSRLPDLLWHWNSRFFLLINFLILSFIQGGSLSSHKIILLRIKLWKIFSNVLLKSSTCSCTFLPEDRPIKTFNRVVNWVCLRSIVIPNFTAMWWRILNY